ncbi:transcriptional regulator, TetR family [Epsilonproteobacteria bacterium SCGC AD-308-O04]|jgi:AcrR family transcriptional regulator|nr:transcriptional regulator, TetR family [Epsilonproteobacteria bacterium SCGC AD-308-O04]
MAIIVDKVQKRKDIALACKELFFQNGISNLTISQIAKTAGVGKGTIYDYFKNKEDIVFEIVNILIQERNIIKEKKLSQTANTKDKIKLFSEFFYNDEDAELRQLYREFISISLVKQDKDMIDFQTQCSNSYFHWFSKIIQDGIDRGELIEASNKFARGLFVMAEGMFITSEVTNSISDLKQEIHDSVDALFDLIEVKR